MMNARERMLLGGLAHTLSRSQVELAGSHLTLLHGKSIRFEYKDEGEKTSEHCTLERGVEILLCAEATNGVLSVVDGTVKPWGSSWSA
ncbi:unnamed protein product [Rhizoctonia solani]|uniref:Uncharacterized protein n=1 Tax=Rhizoctonia solani TaxID=456999 RepID=A0A8H3B7D6_9AGAM|nr:unnamed protein product [Rhizoctonia solani]